MGFVCWFVDRLFTAPAWTGVLMEALCSVVTRMELSEFGVLAVTSYPISSMSFSFVGFIYHSFVLWANSYTLHYKVLWRIFCFMSILGSDLYLFVRTCLSKLLLFCSYVDFIDNLANWSNNNRLVRDTPNLKLYKKQYIWLTNNSFLPLPIMNIYVHKRWSYQFLSFNRFEFVLIQWNTR